MAEHVRQIRVKAEIDTNKMTYSMSERVVSMAAGEEALEEFFDGFREEFDEDASLLSQAKELIRNALLLRMHGDISHMPMSQSAWDQQAEAFLREHDQED